jgi:hypothetical protein
MKMTYTRKLSLADDQKQFSQRPTPLTVTKIIFLLTSNNMRNYKKEIVELKNKTFHEDDRKNN